MIDYDKDPRHKRNRAFTGQAERGAYTHGLGHEIGGGGGGGRVTGQYGSGPMVPAAPPPKPPPRDATLDLINKIKADYSKRMGIEVATEESRVCTALFRSQSWEREGLATTSCQAVTAVRFGRSSGATLWQHGRGGGLSGG